MHVNTRKIYNNWPLIVALLAGLLFTTLRITEYNLEYYPGNWGDARLNMYFLEHSHQYFITGESIAETYWDAPFMYPTEEVITYSDNLLGTFIIYSFFRLIGCSVILSFTLWFISLSVLNFIATYFFAKWLFRNNYSAAIAAFIFAFSIALFCQTSHAQTFPRFAIPLAFWAVLLFREKLSLNYLLLTILLVSYQIYCGVYLGFLLLAPIALLIVIAVFNNASLFFSKIKKTRYALGLLLCSVIGFLSLLPIIIPYYARSQVLSDYRTYERIEHTIPRIKSFFFTNHASLTWSFLKDVGKDLENWWGHLLFPGGAAWFSIFILLIIVLIKLKKRSLSFRSRGVQLAIVAFITFSLFTNVDGFSLYEYVMNLPGFGSIRAVYRVINIELLFFSLPAAYLFKYVFSKHKFQHLFFLLVVALLVLDNYGTDKIFYRRPIAETEKRVDLISEKIAHLPRGSIISYEPYTMTENSIYYHVDGMLAAQRHGLKSLNGYSATCPSTFRPYWRNPNSKSRENWLKDFSVDSVFVIN